MRGLITEMIRLRQLYHASLGLMHSSTVLEKKKLLLKYFFPYIEVTGVLRRKEQVYPSPQARFFFGC